MTLYPSPQWHAVDILLNGVCIDGYANETDFDTANSVALVYKEDADLLAIDCCVEDGSISNDTDTLITCGGCMYKMGTDKVLSHCLPDSLMDVMKRVNQVAEGRGFKPMNGWNTIKLMSYI